MWLWQITNATEGNWRYTYVFQSETFPLMPQKPATIRLSRERETVSSLPFIINQLKHSVFPGSMTKQIEWQVYSSAWFLSRKFTFPGLIFIFILLVFYNLFKHLLSDMTSFDVFHPSIDLPRPVKSLRPRIQQLPPVVPQKKVGNKEGGEGRGGEGRGGPLQITPQREAEAGQKVREDDAFFYGHTHTHTQKYIYLLYYIYTSDWTVYIHIYGAMLQNTDG